MFSLPVLELLLLQIRSWNTLDPDFGWHLSLGKHSLETGKFTDRFIGYNVFENIYTIDHQWLSDVLMYWFYQHIGYWSLLLISFLIISLSFWLIYQVAKKKTGANFGVFGLLVATLPIGLIYCGVRVQYLLYLGAALLIYIHTFVKSWKLRYLLYFLVFALGNSLHGGFLVITIIPLLLELNGMSPKFLLFRSASFSLLKEPEKRTQNNIVRACRELLHPRSTEDLPAGEAGSKNKNIISVLQYAALILIIFSSFWITPYGIEYWKFMLSYLNAPYYQTHIMEWFPIYNFPFHYVQVFLVLALIIFLFTINKFWKKIKVNELVLLSILLILGIKSVRAFPLFIFVSVPYLALALENIFSTLNISQKKVTLLNVIMFILISGYLIANMDFSTPKKNPFQGNDYYPEDAANYLEKVLPKEGNLLSPYNWGGYLSWTHPDIKIFIDGRNPNAFAYGTTTILEENDRFYDSDTKVIQNQLEKYDVSSALIQKPSASIPSALDKFLLKSTGYNLNEVMNPKNNLISYLSSPQQQEQWQKVYEDNKAIIFLKK